MNDDLTQLARLARPFPRRFVKSNPSGGGSYVKHSIVNEKLLAVLGAFDFELVEVIRGDLPEAAADPQGKSQRARGGAPALSQCVVGAVCRLSAIVDGRSVAVSEVGDCEDPRNWPHDGARLKDAMSDGLKRCAMRLGVGLHLWSQDEFTLFDQLWKQSADPTDEDDLTRPFDAETAPQGTPGSTSPARPVVGHPDVDASTATPNEPAEGTMVEAEEGDDGGVPGEVTSPSSSPTHAKLTRQDIKVPANEWQITNVRTTHEALIHPS